MIVQKLRDWFVELREKRRKEKEAIILAYQNQKMKFDLAECVYDTFTGNPDVRFMDNDGNVHTWVDFISEFKKNFKVDEHLTFTLHRFYMGYMNRVIYGEKFKEEFYCEVTYYIDGIPVPWGNDYVALTKKAIAKIRQDAEEYRKRKEAAIEGYMENLKKEQSKDDEDKMED